MSARSSGNGASDDDRWFEALAGRDTGAGRSATDLEAQMLRMAVRRMPSPAIPELSAAGRQRLHDALRGSHEATAPSFGRPGRFSSWRCSGCRRRAAAVREWLARPRAAFGGAVAAGLAGIVTVLTWPSPPEVPGFQQQPPALRGTARPGISIVVAVDPQASRNLLATGLTAQGATVTRYERLGRFGIDAVLPQPLSPTLRSLLAEASVAANGEGEVRVEFEAQRP